MASVLIVQACHAKSVAWTNRVISPGINNVSNGFTIRRLFGQFRWLSCNKPALFSESKSEYYHLLACSYGSYLQSMLKLVPWFVVTSPTKGACGANQIAYTDIGSAARLFSRTGPWSEKHCQQSTALLGTNNTRFESLFSSQCYLIST